MTVSIGLKFKCIDLVEEEKPIAELYEHWISRRIEIHNWVMCSLIEVDWTLTSLSNPAETPL